MPKRKRDSSSEVESLAPLDSVLSVSMPQTCKSYLLVRKPKFSYDPSGISRALRGKSQFKKFEVPDDFQVPAEFLVDGSVSVGMEIQQSSDVQDMVLGYTRFDSPRKILWRGQKIVIVESTHSLFVIRNASGKLYFHVFAPRIQADQFAWLADEALKGLGLYVNTLRLPRDTLSKLQEELRGQQLDSRLMDIDSGASLSYWRGPDLTQSPTYRQTERRAKRIRGYMLRAESPWNSEEHVVIGMGDDCLTRFYTSVTYENHLGFVAKSVLTKAYGGAKLSPGGIPLSAFA